MRHWIGFAAVFVFLAGGAEAGTFDLTFNDDSAQVGFGGRLSADEPGRSALRGRLLFNDREDTLLVSMGGDFTGSPEVLPEVDLTLGVQLLGGRTDPGREFLGIGIGGGATYHLPVIEGLSAGARFSYVPEILAFLDAERMLESAVRAGYAITSNATLLLEYQIIRLAVEGEGKSWSIDEGLRVGLEARF